MGNDKFSNYLNLLFKKASIAERETYGRGVAPLV
jgi:hypothetical protein